MVIEPINLYLLKYKYFYKSVLQFNNLGLIFQVIYL